MNDSEKLFTIHNKMLELRKTYYECSKFINEADERVRVCIATGYRTGVEEWTNTKLYFLDLKARTKNELIKLYSQAESIIRKSIYF